MDGASKYVKGDATAGLIITLINIVGGLIMGMTQQGLSFSDAISKYTILTIGDGLVSQIPSMMISLSTGILVTKASKEENIGDIRSDSYSVFQRYCCSLVSQCFCSVYSHH